MAQPLSTILVLPSRGLSLNFLIRAKLNRCLWIRKDMVIHTALCSMELRPWEPSPVVLAEDTNLSDNLFTKSDEILDLRSKSVSQEHITGEKVSKPDDSSSPQLSFFKWPLWLLGPSLLLTTGMVPTLWLPLSSIYVGPEVASVLSLIGLDCIFHLGATLFLLMADFCSRPKTIGEFRVKTPPLSYKFWNMIASLMGLMIPLVTLLGSLKGVLNPPLPLISFAVLLGPYFLLLSVQMLTEILTWHWRSPVWLVTPVTYEAYRVLQLMRGLKLAAELSSPAWTLQAIRGLICWWILVLGVQLMSVAWFAGFIAQPKK